MDNKIHIKIAGEKELKSIKISSFYNPEITDSMKNEWNNMIEKIAETYEVDSCAILQLREKDLNVCSTNFSYKNPISENSSEKIDQDLYCNLVIEKGEYIFIKDANKEGIWKENPHLKSGMISYMGIPVFWPNSVLFGTICVMNSTEIKNPVKLKNHLFVLKSSIENDLNLLEEKEKLELDIKRANAFLEITDTIVVSLDCEGKITFINGEGCSILGYEKQELIGKNWFDLFTPLKKNVKRQKDYYESMLKGNTDDITKVNHQKIKNKEGKIRIISWNISYLKDQENKTIGTLSSGRDITEEYELKNTLNFEREIFYQIAENVGEILWIKDTSNDSIIFINSLYETLWGCSKKDIYEDPKAFIKIVHPDDREKVEKAYAEMKSTGSWIFDEEYRIIRESGEILWFRAKTFPVYDENGNIYRSVGVSENITYAKKMEEELINQATKDFLTGAFNRRYFFDKGDDELQRSLRYSHEFCVLMLDIDHFKKVNDVYGHIAGDTVLKQFTSECLNVLRKSDVFARIGGEEFAVILPETNIIGANTIAERLRKSIENMTVQDETENQDIKITTSIGISSLKDGDINFENILKRADEALYDAKESGRNKVEIL